MSVLDRAITHSGVLEHRAHTHVPPLRYSRVCQRCCYAKAKLNDDEQENQTSHRGFTIRVPTIPSLGDVESARRLLESAFQSLSFDMPKLPIDSALQGLALGIPKLSIPMRVLVLDITGFVVTKLKRSRKKAMEDIPLDENEYPRCAWPRVMKGAQIAEVANFGLLENQQEQEASYQIPVGPHCAWPRITGQTAKASGSSSSCSIISDVQYPHSAWPRGSVPTNGVVLAGKQLAIEVKKLGVAEKEEESSPCIIEGGARCAWPRKKVSAKQSYYAAENRNNAENLEVSQLTEDSSGGKVPPAECDEAAELPRRMLATSVGLTVMNQLAKGSIVTSIFDFCSSLPAGSLEISEEEDAAMDLGRRTLLVVLKNSGG